MEQPIKLVLPVTDDGVKTTTPAQVLTPEQIEAKRVADELAAAQLEADKNKPKVKIGEIEYLLNETGDAIDAQGKVVKTKAELTPVPDVESIIIDDITYTLNANGDAIKADNTVLMTKAAIDAASNTEPEGDDPFEIIQTTLDFKPEVNGAPVTYEKTKAGLEQLVLDAATAQGEAIAKAKIDAYWESSPKLKQLRDHITLGGSSDNFRPQTDWKAIQIDTLTDEQLEQVVTAERLTKGDSPELAKYYVDGLKRDGKLKEFAPQSVTYLATAQTAREEAAKTIRLQQEKAENDANEAYWNDIKTAITTKKLKIRDEEFVIPESFRVKEDGKVVIKTITDFNDYINKPKIFTVHGKQIKATQNEYDVAVESATSNAHTDVFNALRRFLKYDDSQLVAAKAKFEEVKTIRRIVSRDGAKSVAAAGGPIKLILPVKSNS